MTRFFTSPENINGKTASLCAEDAEHIRSLRLRPDEQFVVCNGNGADYVCVLGEAAASRGAKAPEARIVSKHRSAAEPNISCTVYLAYTKGDRLDTAVQKSVELGAHKIVLFKSERCVAKPSNIPQKLERLQRVSLEAAKQSGRGKVPAVLSLGEFKYALDAAVKDDLAILFYEEEKNMSLSTVLEHHFPKEALIKGARGKIRSIAIITGPEGGFEEVEVKRAQAKNISVASLGPRILRSETAPIAALSAIMYHTGNL